MSEDRSDDAADETAAATDGSGDHTDETVAATDGNEDHTDGPWADVNAPQESADDEDGDGWKFDLEDVDADGVVQRAPIEPEAIELESAVFVLLGIAATVALLARMAMLLT